MSSTRERANLDAVFKAYDVRGVVPAQLDEELAAATGAAFVAVTGAEGVVVGHDMRPSSPSLARAFAEGASRKGADVLFLGLASTDQLYFASGTHGLPGAMFTASHNPAQYNGIKLCRAHAQPISSATGLTRIRDLVAAGGSPRHDHPGRITDLDCLADYAAFLHDLVPVGRPVLGRPLRVVVDAGNGMAGLTAPAVFGSLADRIELVELYFDLDGTFPNHEANPIEPANLLDLRRRVVAEGADVGLAFDGDADRCFLVDEQGHAVDPSALTALIAARELEREPGSAIIHNLITSRSVPQIVTELGGRPIRTRVGHSFIKAVMAETDAVFGGEHSGHFYFRDFWRADSGMLAALHALAALAATRTPLSGLIADYQRYVASGEINSVVADQHAVLHEIEDTWRHRDGVRIDHLDGLTVDAADWWFNVRASNTEPLLRLNVEGGHETTMAAVRDEVLAMIRATNTGEG